MLYQSIHPFLMFDKFFESRRCRPRFSTKRVPHLRRGIIAVKVGLFYL
jgi:hypothetical protein